MKHAFVGAALALALFACTPFDSSPPPPVAIDPPPLDLEPAPIEQIGERAEQKLEAIEQKIEEIVKEAQELPGEVREVAFEQVLDAWAREHLLATGEALDWRSSLVDLLKLVGFDASRGGRRKLSEAFGRRRYAGSAHENVWLHAHVLASLKEGA
jgi:hypothetical protein